MTKSRMGDRWRASPSSYKKVGSRDTNRGGGAEGSRTPVQTHSSKAFYMLISLLVVGSKQEMNKPIYYVAEFPSDRVFCCIHSLMQQHSVFELSRRRSLVTERPAPAALMTN